IIIIIIITIIIIIIILLLLAFDHTERPASVLEKSGPRQSITSANPKGSTIRNGTHPMKISLRFLGSGRELESRERRDHIPVQMSELREGKNNNNNKRRLQCKIKTLRADVSSLEHLKANILQNRHTKERLIRKYQLERKTVTEVAQDLKQRIRATAKKV